MALVGISVVVAFLVVAGIITTLGQHAKRAREARVAADRVLKAEAQAWDRRVEQLGVQWLSQLDNEDRITRIPNLERKQQRLVPWFDAYYLWEREGDGPALILHPPPIVEEDLPAINRAPCMRNAIEVEQAQGPEDAVAALLLCETHPERTVRLFSNVYAAHLLLQQGQAEQALSTLQRFEVPPLLEVAAGEGLPPRRVVLRQLLLADILAATGQRELASAQLQVLSWDIAEQNGRVLAVVLDDLNKRVLPRLDELGEQDQARKLEPLVREATRRLAGWQEVESRLSASATYTERPKLVHDQYKDDSYLLIYDSLDEVGRFGAVQLDQPTLLAQMIDEADDNRPHLLVTNAEGVRLAGDAEGLPVVAEAAFPRMLTHLRLAFRGERLVPALQDNSWQTFKEGLSFSVLSLVGIGAILALNSVYKREQELRERQREFVTRVTHELKTPLAGIRVMAESLEMVGPSDEQTLSTFSQRIVGEADRLTERIEEILAVARARRPASPEAYDLSDLIEDLLDEWEPRMTVKGVLLDRDVRALPQAFGDRALVRDAVVCLLDNALKYQREDRSDPKVLVSLRKERGMAVLEVLDNGIGVPPAKRKVIFERFARVEGPKRGKAGGHGLGLAFVAEAVSSQDGRVECNEGIGGGARFVMRLPLS